jgi:hypothetical protein
MLGLSVPVWKLAASYILDTFNPPLTPFVERILDPARIIAGLQHECGMCRAASRCACALEAQIHAPSDRIAAIERPAMGRVTVQRTSHAMCWRKQGGDLSSFSRMCKLASEGIRRDEDRIASVQKAINWLPARPEVCSLVVVVMTDD